MSTENKKLVTKRDALIICIVLAAGLLTAVFFKTCSHSGSEAVISVDSKTIKTIELSGHQKTYRPDEAEGAVIEISDGRVCVSDSDCPDKICVNTGWISRKGERIVCLPKKLIVEIK